MRIPSYALPWWVTPFLTALQSSTVLALHRVKVSSVWIPENSQPAQSWPRENLPRVICQTLSRVTVGVYVDVCALMRPSYLQEMSSRTGKQCAAVQPVLARDKLL
jgi:hypothetical protein